ncbi:MAG: DUF6172 family protein [Pseudomonadota bacterium]
MKKTFQLNIEGKIRDRVVEAVKHDIRKYLKRERRRDVPEGADFWDFDCRFGLTEAQAESTHLANLMALISAAVAEGADSFYVEILARPGVRKARPAGAAGSDVLEGELDGDSDDA